VTRLPSAEDLAAELHPFTGGRGTHLAHQQGLMRCAAEHAIRARDEQWRKALEAEADDYLSPACDNCDRTDEIRRHSPSRCGSRAQRPERALRAAARLADGGPQ
jgi:hypothetical protein